MIKQDKKTYIAIDLKSFYASVECVERGLDPLNTNLVVADNRRTEKTICLAVSPSLKSYGVGSRPRLFELNQVVKKINSDRLSKNKYFTGKSYFYDELEADTSLELDYIVAVPRMAYYMKYSTRIYAIYLKYVAPEDIHIYSVDEVFIDATPYLISYNRNPFSFAKTIIKDVLNETGITATVGIGTNLYLAKVAMDILAKKMPANKDGARIAGLDEITYRKLMWHHKPITDFWRVGKGYAKRLEGNGLYTMGDIALCSLGSYKEYYDEYYNEDLLYRLFGKNAELLIDHAWGYEPCTIKDIKSYKPKSKSIGTSQVLHEMYTASRARLVAWEMADALVLQLVEKNLLTNQVVLSLSYDVQNLKDPVIRSKYKGEITVDAYGRKKPKSARGTINLDEYTLSGKIIREAVIELYDSIVNPNLLIRKISISINKLISIEKANKKQNKQLSIFMDYDALEHKEMALKKEASLQKTVLNVRKKYGKNAMLKGANLQEGATAKIRNAQIGGHKA